MVTNTEQYRPIRGFRYRSGREPGYLRRSAQKVVVDSLGQRMLPDVASLRGARHAAFSIVVATLDGRHHFPAFLQMLLQRQYTDIAVVRSRPWLF